MTDEMRERIKVNPGLMHHTREWKRKRLDILRRDHWECQRCIGKFGKLGKTEKKKICTANTVHHIQPVELRPDLMWDDDNLISLCHDCHDIIHGRTPKLFSKKKKTCADERW